MSFLFSYVRPYWKLLLLILLLASINQVFSLLDPQVMRWLMDNYLTQPDSRTPTEFFHGIFLWASGFVLTAMISRLAKNFQDYFINVMTQKIWTSIYQNTISHTFSLPYAAFEDQQSWQLLQKLIKAKESIQTYIANLISIVFFSLVGIVFVLIYSFSVDRRVGLAYLLLMPIVWFTTMSLSKKIKSAQASMGYRTRRAICCVN